MILVVIALATAPAIDEVTTAYDTCIEHSATRLERSGEAAPIVADLVLGDCRPIIATDRENKLASKPANSTWTDAEYRDLVNFRYELLERIAHRRAIRVIVEVRAARAEN